MARGGWGQVAPSAVLGGGAETMVYYFILFTTEVLNNKLTHVEGNARMTSKKGHRPLSALLHPSNVVKSSISTNIAIAIFDLNYRERKIYTLIYTLPRATNTLATALGCNRVLNNA